MKRPAGQVTVGESNGTARVTIPADVYEVLGDPDEVVWFVDNGEVSVVPPEEVAPR